MLVGAGLPQLLRVIRQGHADGISEKYLSMLVVGFISMTIFSLLTSAPKPVVISYAIQIVVFSIMTFYKFFPRR